MEWLVVLALILVGLFLSGIFSGAETGLYCVSRVRLQLASHANEPRALRLQQVLVDPQEALSTTLIGTNLMNYMVTTTVAYLFADLWGFSELDTELYTVIVLTPIVFVFGEMIPKTLFQRHPNELMMRCGRWLAWAGIVCRWSGVVWGLKQATLLMGRLGGGGRESAIASGPKRRMAILLQEGLAGHLDGHDQSALVDRVCRLSETPVHEAMVPSNRVMSLTATADRRELTRMARRTTYAALPVWRRRRRHVIGIVLVDDLLRDKGWVQVGDRVTAVPTLSPHKTVAEAIAKLQASGQGIAIVTDRTGQLLGLVTLKDLLEEVVGDLSRPFESDHQLG